MVEVMASTQNIGFRSGTRRSLFTQQNPGLNSVKAVSQQPNEKDSPGNFAYSDLVTAASSHQPTRNDGAERLKTVPG